MSNQKFTTATDPLPLVTFPVILEDDPIHCPPYYFCATDDPTCPCREDASLLERVVAEYNTGFLTGDEAARIVQGRQANS
jgi:hypothetical protein